MGHTCIGKHNFEFDASPLVILLSRILIAAVLGLLFFIEINYGLIWAGADIGVFLLGTLALTPFAVVRGRAFIARHTVHRTVRFHYRREYLWAARLFAVYSLFIILLYAGSFTEDEENFPFVVLGALAIGGYVLSAPALFYYSHHIQISQLQFGKLRLHFDSSVSRYYLASIKAILFAAFLGFCAFSLLRFSAERIDDFGMFTLLFAFLLFLFILHAVSLFQSAFTCTYWKSIRIGDDSSVDASKLTLTGYSDLLVQNYAMILFSLGLLYPIARVRAYRYIAEHVEIKLGPKTAAQYHESTDKTSPLAGEFTDLTDWDIDFGAF